MKKLKLFLLASLVFGIGVFAYGAIAKANMKPVEPPKTVSTPTVEGLLAFTNLERAKAGVKPLELNPLLNKSAQMKVDEMEREQHFGHERLSDGRHGYLYIGDVGVSCKRGSENLAGDAYKHSSQQTVQTWMSSKMGHREALLSPDFEQVGFAISEHYIAQHFCDTM